MRAAILGALVLFTPGCDKPDPLRESDATAVRDSAINSADPSQPATGADDAPANPVRSSATALPGGVTPIDWPAGMDAMRLRGTVKNAIDYLVRTTDEQGKFAYIVNTDPEVPATNEYNVVRHAGTMYGLGMFLERYDDPDGKVKAALIQQGKFLRAQMEPVPGQKGMIAIWSKPEVTGLKDLSRAELGSAGLGLIGLTALEQAAPGNVRQEDLRGLARFIRFMQMEDGSFYRVYVPEGPGRINAQPLLFYPGESALGLVMLYEVDGDVTWLNAAALAVGHMARQRDREGRPLLDHWLTLASARLWPHLNRVTVEFDRDEVIQFTRDLCERLMLTSKPIVDDARLKGCITGSGMTCPTATRVEGLMAALSYLPAETTEDLELRSRIQFVAEDALEFLIASQVDTGEYRGGIPYAVIRLPDDHPLQRHRFNELSGEIRIDYVHHAISGMMLYDDAFLRD